MREFDTRLKDFPVGDNFVKFSETFSLDYVLKLLGEYWSWSFLGIKGKCDTEQYCWHLKELKLTFLTAVLEYVPASKSIMPLWLLIWMTAVYYFMR